MQLTKRQVQVILDNAPVGVDKTKILDGLVQRGYELEGVDTAKVKQRLAQANVPKQGFMAETGQDIKSTIQNIGAAGDEASRGVGEAIQATRRGEQGWGSSIFQSLGSLAKGASGVIGSAFTGAIKSILPQGAEDAIKGKVAEVATPIVQSAPIQALMKNYEALANDSSPEAQRIKRDLDALMGIGEFALDLTGAGLGKKAGTAVVDVAKTVTRSGEEAVGNLIDVAKVGTKTLIEKTGPVAPSPLDAVGQVLQGQTKDVVAGVRGLSNLDTAGVQTFDDLLKTVNKKIPELAKQVDDELLKDTKLYSLSELKVSAKTVAGKVVKVGYVERAIEHLEELYKSIGDVVNQKNMRDLLIRAKNAGLTRKEVNDLARTYGEEFGAKAFNKIGDPLTSVNAQRFENTRSALKNVARGGVGGAEARVADRAMSALYKTQKLVQKNVEAVNKLRQKIQERGLLEKIGHAAAKGLDLISGGTIRGLVGGLLPRGVGYKVMNALDLEKALSKNLEIIQKAIKDGSDSEIMKFLESKILDGPK